MDFLPYFFAAVAQRWSRTYTDPLQREETFRNRPRKNELPLFP